MEATTTVSEPTATEATEVKAEVPLTKHNSETALTNASSEAEEVSDQPALSNWAADWCKWSQPASSFPLVLDMSL